MRKLTLLLLLLCFVVAFDADMTSGGVATSHPTSPASIPLDCGLEPDHSGVLCGATNTGIAGKGLTTGNLTTLAGNGATTANGQVISRRIRNGDICIVHNDVTITESQINGQIYVGRRNACTGSGDVTVTGTIIQDSTIDPGGALEGISDVQGTNSIYRRNNISAAQNFITIWTGTNAQILSNYGHDESSSDVGQHFDGIEAYCWKSGLTIRNNAIYQTVGSGATAPLNITSTGCTPTGTMLVEYNLFRSANSAYVILIDNRQGTPMPSATFTSNRLWRVSGGGWFSKLGSGGPYSGSGNVDHISDSPVSVP